MLGTVCMVQGDRSWRADDSPPRDRDPPRARSQKVFSAGFVYLPEPGQTPDLEMLQLHRDYRDKVIEHWSHIAGGRSEITTSVAPAGR